MRRIDAIVPWANLRFTGGCCLVKYRISSTYVWSGLNCHYFNILGDGKLNPIVGVYIPIKRIPIKGGMTIPNIVTFDHGTYVSFKNKRKRRKVGNLGNLSISTVGGFHAIWESSQAKNYVFSVSIFTTAGLSAVVLRHWPPWQFYLGASICVAWDEGLVGSSCQDANDLFLGSWFGYTDIMCHDLISTCNVERCIITVSLYTHPKLHDDFPKQSPGLCVHFSGFHVVFRGYTYYIYIYTISGNPFWM